MLAFNLRNILLIKGIKEPYPFLKKMGISKTIAQRYLNGKAAKISFKHLNALCEELRLLPGEFFIWQNTSENLMEDHPLQEIRSGAPAPNLEQYTAKMSVKEIKRTEDVMRKIMEEGVYARKKRIEERE